MAKILTRRKSLSFWLGLWLVACFVSATGCGGGAGENQVGVSDAGMTDEEMEAYSEEADALNEE